MSESKFTDEHIGYVVLGLVLVAVAGFFGWQGGVFSSWFDQEPAGRDSLIKPIAYDVTQFDMDKVTLGRRLYHDGILSGDGSISCATCHAVEQGGAEARRVSIGVDGAPGPINAPTVLNSGFNFVQFWDGRAKDLHEQAGGPMTNPIEMHSNFTIITERLREEPWYKERFATVYPNRGITEETITEAVAHYEDSLQTPSPFDAWLAGDDGAIDAQAVRGHQTFAEVGCTTCHNGINVGGNSYQKMGLVKDYFEERGGEVTEADLGRYNVTKDESDKHKFKVPTLRNITLTAPYFHDGSTWELRDAVRTMGRVQLGRDLSDEQVSDIVAFLESLEGQLPAHALIPENEEPPARLYPLEPTYDVALVYYGADAEVPARVLGSVTTSEPYEKTLAKSRFPTRDGAAEGLVASTEAPSVSGEPVAQTCFAFAIEALKNLERGRAEMRFVDDAVEVSVSGEGTPEGIEGARAAFEAVPEGCQIGADLAVYDSTLAAQCDERLGAIQGTTKLAFATGSSELTESAQGQLRDVAQALHGCPEQLRLRIDGHTDNTGDESANLRLSRRRAFAVRDVLMRLGLDPARLIARGYGATHPVEDNTSAEGRAANRRIELRLDRPGVSFWSDNSGNSTAVDSENVPTTNVSGDDAETSSAVLPPRPAGAAPHKPVGTQPVATDASRPRPRPRLDAAVPSVRKPKIPTQPVVPPPRDVTAPAPAE